MSNAVMPPELPTPGGDRGWGIPVAGVLCTACDWRYLVPEAAVPERCPHCAATALVVLDDATAAFPYMHPPELVVPFSLREDQIATTIAEFAQGIPFPPADLDPAVLRSRMQHLYLPMWLIDADAEAHWQAEVGFDYEVVSHQERYADSAGWQTERVRERRIRWEPRVGRLVRHYDNVAAPAMEAQAFLRRLMGQMSLERAVPFQISALTHAAVRAPDLTPEAAWPEAAPAFLARASQECRHAAQADHIRSFRWDPVYHNRNWTLLLLPFYASYYLDDAGTAQWLLVNGQTGQVFGARRGSMARAQKTALTIGAVALVLFVLSLALGLFSFLVPPLLAVGIAGVLLAVVVGAGAFVPIARVWAFNRRQTQRSQEV